MSSDPDGVTAYRQNDRSVEGLTNDQLSDILEAFPRSSDAYMRASLELGNRYERKHLRGELIDG